MGALVAGALEGIKPNLHMCLWSLPNPALRGEPIVSHFSCYICFFLTSLETRATLSTSEP